MRWSLRDVVAAVFAAEAVLFLLRSLVYVAEGWRLNLPWFIGLVLTPASFLGAAWFVRRREPPTLLTAAIVRPVVLFVAVAWNLITVYYAITVGHVRLI
jgi:hypothetical protein